MEPVQRQQPGCVGGCSRVARDADDLPPAGLGASVLPDGLPDGEDILGPGKGDRVQRLGRDPDLPLLQPAVLRELQFGPLGRHLAVNRLHKRPEGRRAAAEQPVAERRLDDAQVRRRPEQLRRKLGKQLLEIFPPRFERRLDRPAGFSRRRSPRHDSALRRLRAGTARSRRCPVSAEPPASAPPPPFRKDPPDTLRLRGGGGPPIRFSLPCRFLPLDAERGADRVLRSIPSAPMPPIIVGSFARSNSQERRSPITVLPPSPFQPNWITPHLRWRAVLQPFACAVIG